MSTPQSSITITQVGRRYLNLYNIIPNSQLSSEQPLGQDGLEDQNLLKNQAQSASMQSYGQMFPNILKKQIKNTGNNLNRSQHQKTTNNLKQKKPQQQYEAQLRQLSFRLNKLYKNQRLLQAENTLKKSVKILQEQLTKDLGYSNSYTTKKAQKMAEKLFRTITKQPYHPSEDHLSQEQQVSQGQGQIQGKGGQSILKMQLSKGRNYLARINYLYGGMFGKQNI